MPPVPDPDLAALASARRESGQTVSVCLPARDEETTIGHIVNTVQRELVERFGVVDEIVVIDDGSTDATAAAARDEGARVVREADILPSLAAGSGKGNVLWKSLHECRGDIICWLDADIRNFGPHFVTRLLDPLLESDTVVFSKAYYRRPLHGEPTGGGRVTELMARPLLSHLFPKVADIVQPLAGEYAGRRRVLEQVPFVQGWGVEIALLIDLVERFGRDSIAQVDLGVREHRNRPLDALGAQALAILVAALCRAEQPGAAGDRAAIDALVEAELVRFDDAYAVERVPVEVRERPPIVTVPEYRARFHEPPCERAS